MVETRGRSNQRSRPNRALLRRRVMCRYPTTKAGCRDDLPMDSWNCTSCRRSAGVSYSSLAAARASSGSTRNWPGNSPRPAVWGRRQLAQLRRRQAVAGTARLGQRRAVAGAAGRRARRPPVLGEAAARRGRGAADQRGRSAQRHPILARDPDLRQSTRVSFEATMKNIDTKPRRWGIWAHTQLDGAADSGRTQPSSDAGLVPTPTRRVTFPQATR